MRKMKMMWKTAVPAPSTNSEGGLASPPLESPIRSTASAGQEEERRVVHSIERERDLRRRRTAPAPVRLCSPERTLHPLLSTRGPSATHYCWLSTPYSQPEIGHLVQILQIAPPVRLGGPPSEGAPWGKRLMLPPEGARLAGASEVPGARDHPPAPVDEAPLTGEKERPGGGSIFADPLPLVSP